MRDERQIDKAIGVWRHAIDNRKSSATGSERSNLLAALRLLQMAGNAVGMAAEFVSRADDDALALHVEVAADD